MPTFDIRTVSLRVGELGRDVFGYFIRGYPFDTIVTPDGYRIPGATVNGQGFAYGFRHLELNPVKVVDPLGR